MPNNHPTRVVREDPDREGLLYAGTEFGMFVSFDDGMHWQSFQKNLPATPVTDIKVFRQDLVLSTMGRGFWVMDDVTPLHELDDQVMAASNHLFESREAIRWRYRGGGFGPSDPADPEFPPVGATIDYYFATAPRGPVTLEIMDETGNVIRGFSSEAAGERMIEPMDPGMREFRLERVGTPRLPKNAGLNRFVWDLSHAGPWDSNPQRSGRNGPTAAPGLYTARLSTGNWNATTTLIVEMDPRIVDDGVMATDIEDQVALALRVRDALSEARLAVTRLTDAKSDYEGQNNRRARQALEELQELETQFVTDQTEGVRYPQPMLVDQFGYLYGNLDRADQKPSRDAQQRFDQLRTLLDGYIERLERLVATDAAAK